MASPLAVPTALGVTSLLAAGTFALSFAVDPRIVGADPAFLDRNSDWVLRVVAAAMLVPIALLVVAVKRHPTLTTTIPTPEVH
jgi:hypothetical protein